MYGENQIKVTKLMFLDSWFLFLDFKNHTGSHQDQAHIQNSFTPVQYTGHTITRQKLHHRTVDSNCNQAKNSHYKHISIFAFELNTTNKSITFSTKEHPNKYRLCSWVCQELTAREREKESHGRVYHEASATYWWSQNRVCHGAIATYWWSQSRVCRGATATYWWSQNSLPWSNCHILMEPK